MTACKDPHHKIGTPIKQQQECKDDTLWLYTLNKPLKGLPTRGKSKQKLFYCKQCSN